jgi:hypothetical protein
MTDSDMEREMNVYWASKLADFCGEDDRKLPIILGSKSGQFLKSCLNKNQAYEDTSVLWLTGEAKGAIILGNQGCLSEETKMPFEFKGRERIASIAEISELVKNEAFGVASYDFAFSEPRKGLAKLFETGEKELLQILTQDGKTVESSSDHTFFKLENGNIIEKKARDLKEGDMLVSWEV